MGRACFGDAPLHICAWWRYFALPRCIASVALPHRRLAPGLCCLVQAIHCPCRPAGCIDWATDCSPRLPAELPARRLAPEARRLPVALHSVTQHGEALAVRVAHYPLLRRLVDTYRGWAVGQLDGGSVCSGRSLQET